MNIPAARRGEIATVATLIGLGVIVLGIAAGSTLVDLGSRFNPFATGETSVCTVRFSTANGQVPIGDSLSMTATVSLGSGATSVDKVEFSINTAKATLNKSGDSNAPYVVQISGISNGTGILTARAIVETSSDADASCTATVPLTIGTGGGATVVPTKTPTRTPSPTGYQSQSDNPTRTPTKTPTRTPTGATKTPTRTPTKSPTKTPTRTPTGATPTSISTPVPNCLAPNICVAANNCRTVAAVGRCSATTLVCCSQIQPTVTPTSAVTMTPTHTPTKTPTSTATPTVPVRTPTILPTPTTAETLTPTPTFSQSPDCLCESDSMCATACLYNTIAGVSYASSYNCAPLYATGTQSLKTHWCRRQDRTRGDADGSDSVNLVDYDYYRRIVLLDTGVPAEVNADFNGDGEVGTADGTIALKALGIIQ